MKTLAITKSQLHDSNPLFLFLPQPIIKNASKVELPIREFAFNSYPKFGCHSLNGIPIQQHLIGQCNELEFFNPIPAPRVCCGPPEINTFNGLAIKSCEIPLSDLSCPLSAPIKSNQDHFSRPFAECPEWSAPTKWHLRRDRIPVEPHHHQFIFVAGVAVVADHRYNSPWTPLIQVVYRRLRSSLTILPLLINLLVQRTKAQKHRSLQQQQSQQPEKLDPLKDKMHDPDLDEYLTEYRLQTPVEPISHYEGKYCWSATRVTRMIYCTDRSPCCNWSPRVTVALLQDNDKVDERDGTNEDEMISDRWLCVVCMSLDGQQSSLKRLHPLSDD